ncbi:hypothetical protein [Bradyrhizobium genosp. P]|uniref:hypothetical protein n=1 Tax=Bradyrhizobium genosp. P TaxID=83641 RepID=UPI003CF496E6
MIALQLGTHPKSRPVPVHPSTPSRRHRGQHNPAAGQRVAQDLLDDGAAVGLDSAE